MMQSSFACFQGTGLFGHYLDREALENIKQYNYKGTGYTCVEKVLDLWWNAAVKNLVPEVSVCLDVIEIVSCVDTLVGVKRLSDVLGYVFCVWFVFE